MIDHLAREYEPDFPGDELIVYRNRVFGFEALVAVPKARVAAALAAEKKNEGPPPLWRHGDVIEVRPAREGAADGSGAGEKA